MLKSELIRRVAIAHDLKQSEASDVIDTVFSLYAESLATDGRVALPSLGSLTVGVKSARTMKLPNGQTTTVPAKKVAKFSAVKALKALLNK